MTDRLATECWGCGQVFDLHTGTVLPEGTKVGQQSINPLRGQHYWHSQECWEATHRSPMGAYKYYEGPVLGMPKSLRDWKDILLVVLSVLLVLACVRIIFP